MSERKNAQQAEATGLEGGNDERLKAVRDLIFGEDMAAYEQEFGQLREQIAQHHLAGKESLASEAAVLNEKLDAMEHSFSEKIKEIKTALAATDDRLDGLTQQVAANRREVGNALQDMAKAFLTDSD